MTRAANVYAKAQRLIDDGRCHALTVVPGKAWVGVVVGEFRALYLVSAVHGDAIRDLRLGTGSVPPNRSCTCEAAQHGQSCSHVEAAAILLRASEPVDAVFARIAQTATLVDDTALVRVHAKAEAVGWPTTELAAEVRRRGLLG